MATRTKLSRSMTVAQFDNGYWYATEIKHFAKAIGIPSASKLRKDELEKAIKLFLQTKRAESPTKRILSKSGIRDIEKGLRLTLPVVNYTSNRENQGFRCEGSKKTCARLRKKVRGTLSPQSLARRATCRGRQDHLRRLGETIRHTQSDRGEVRSYPVRTIHQLPQ